MVIPKKYLIKNQIKIWIVMIILQEINKIDNGRVNSLRKIVKY